MKKHLLHEVKHIAANGEIAAFDHFSKTRRDEVQANFVFQAFHSGTLSHRQRKCVTSVHCKSLNYNLLSTRCKLFSDHSLICFLI